MTVAISPARPISTLLNELKTSYTNIFTLECAIYRTLRGPHNRKVRKEIARYLGLPDKNYNVVKLADEIRTHFDRLRLF